MIKVLEGPPTEPGRYQWKHDDDDKWTIFEVKEDENGDLYIEQYDPGRKEWREEYNLDLSEGEWRKLTYIYIPNKAGHDFEPAKRYGDLVYVSEGFQDKHATNTMQRHWQVALADSTKNDIIMMAGYSHMQAIGCALFGHMHGRINILIFDPDTKRKYILRQNVFEEEEK